MQRGRADEVGEDDGKDLEEALEDAVSLFGGELLGQGMERGGEGGIRTPGTLAGTPDFESGAFDQALPPLRVRSDTRRTGESIARGSESELQAREDHWRKRSAQRAGGDRRRLGRGEPGQPFVFAEVGVTRVRGLAHTLDRELRGAGPERGRAPPDRHSQERGCRPIAARNAGGPRLRPRPASRAIEC